MDNFDNIINSLCFLNETELKTLAEACQTRAEKKKEARRGALRQELMENLQKTIGDILHNDFNLTIKNTERDCYDGYDEVFLVPSDTYSITIE